MRQVSLDENTGAKQFPIYIVDYDLSTKDGTLRRRFYRALERYRREKAPSETGYSSKSVIFTRNLVFARFVRDMATEVGGSATIWEARPFEGPDPIIIDPKTAEEKKTLQEELDRVFGIVFAYKDGLHTDRVASELGMDRNSALKLLNILYREGQIVQPGGRAGWWRA